MIKSQSDDSLILNRKKCVVAVILSYKNQVILLHNTKLQVLNTSVASVTKTSLQTITKCLTGTNYQKDKIAETVIKMMPDEDVISIAYAYSGVHNVSRQFNLEQILKNGNFTIFKHKCPLTDILINNNDQGYNINVFSINLINLTQEQEQYLRNSFVIIDNSKVKIVNELTVTYNGLHMNSFTGNLFLLFWDYEYGIRFN